MSHQNYYKPNVGVVCPGPMTRAALLALRASASLIVGCHYTLTDHVQNRLVAGTTIVLHAVSTTELSERVEVNTTYDNEAWSGIYDIDRGLVLELTDNRGNVAKGLSGNEVANFDWGNTAYSGCRVENARWTVNYGNPSTMLNVFVLQRAHLNTTGFNGSMSDNTFHTVVGADFTNATGIWRYSIWKNSGTFNASGYTGGGDNFYCEFDQSSINLTGQIGVVFFRFSKFQGVSFTVSGASTFSVFASSFNQLLINRPAGGGPVFLNQCFSYQGSTVTVSGAGTLSLSNSRIDGSIQLTSTGNITSNYCHIDSGSSIASFGAAALTMSRVKQFGVGSNVQLDAGSSTPVNLIDVELLSAGTIRVVGAVAGGALNVYSTRVEALSYIYKRHTGFLTIVQSALSGSSAVDAQSGDRNYEFTRLECREFSRVRLTGTNAAVTDIIQDYDISSRGSMSISCSGALNNVLYGQISGFSGALVLSGTTGGQAVNRLKCLDGTISFANCTANVAASLCTATDAGTILFTGVAVAKASSYLHAENQGSIVINNSTGGGSNSTIKVSSGGSFNQSGVASSAQRVDIAQGLVSHNGGSLSTCLKRLVGTLTTGNFNHTNIIHHMNTSRVLTAANSNRAEYVGLAAAAYSVAGILV